MNSKKIKSKLKRIVSATVALAMTATTFSTFSVVAEQQTAVYPYAVFAVQNVKINTEGFTLNGNAYSKGDFVYTSKNSSINGKITDADDIKEKSDNTEDFDVNSDLILIHNKIANKYFSSDCDKKDKDYSLSDVNVNINKSVYVTGKIDLNGNINLNKAVGAVSDIDFSGGTLNGNSTVIYSKFGNINISNNNSSVSGLIYAPFGTVTISGDNFNFDGVIIAENIIIKGKGANINYNKAAAMIVGSESEKFSCDFSDWKYMPDNDKDGLPDLIEKEVGTDPEKEDTDGDKLPDGYEALTLGTDPTKDDTDGNGTKDCDEDQDKDGLTNFEEYNLKTNPNSKDSDKDNLSDGDEINKYKTDPLKKDTDDDGLEDDDEIYFKTDPKNPDTNGNGVKDGDEKFSQTFTHKVKNKDCAVTEVSVSMKGTGNLQKTTTVDSVMNKDMLCTGVVGLVGEPFSVETKSKFDKATLTFKIDKTKLGNTKFDNLMFLWYNEKENNFVELETKLDSAKSTASIETTHFSKYMVVDKQAWFDNWRQIYESYEKLLSTNPSITSICVDCSGSMSTNDPSFQLYDHTSSCYRNLAVQGFAEAMLDSDKTSIITFEDFAKEVCSLTNNKDTLKSNARFYNGGGTNANSAIDIALKELKNESGNKSIILMSDGDVNVTDANIKLAEKNGIKIHTVGLGYGADNAKLKQYAKETGGEHFIVETAVGLELIYKNISDNNKTDFSSMKDSDGDGVPDEIEQVSGIPMPNGELVFTDPEKKDTDGDGLSDGDEIGKIVIMPFVGEKPDKSLYKFLFNVKSDPTKIDTQKSQELLDYLTEELNKMMPPEYDENGNKINSHNKECDKTWNYFNEHIWIYLPEYTTSPQSRYAAYTAWLRETYGTSGLEKFWTTTDKYVDVFYDEIVNITDTIPKATKQIFYGNYSDEVTVTGTTGQIAIGFSGVDFVADIRDVTYDVDHWEWSWSHARQTGLDMIGVLPVVGILKNCDEFAALKNVSRLDADNAIEESVESINSMLKAGKNVDEIAGIERAALVNKLNKLVEADITKIAEKYENLQCVECANAIQKHLEQLDIHGVRINLQCKLTEGGNYFGNIALKSEDRIISMNGKHTAILFNNKVYDNIYPNGISYKDWKNEFDYLYPNVYAEFNEINF